MPEHRIRVYLFANLGAYGREFVRSLRRPPPDLPPVTVMVDPDDAPGAGWPGPEVHIVEDVNAAEFIAASAGAIGIVAGFVQIFSPQAIAAYASLVNVHPSILPYYRGPTPTQWCLLQGERHTGLTLHRVSSAIDAGEVLFQRTVEIRPGDTLEELDTRIARSALPVVFDFVRAAASRSRPPLASVDGRRVYRCLQGYRGRPSTGAGRA